MCRRLFVGRIERTTAHTADHSNAGVDGSAGNVPDGVGESSDKTEYQRSRWNLPWRSGSAPYALVDPESTDLPWTHSKYPLIESYAHRVAIGKVQCQHSRSVIPETLPGEKDLFDVVWSQL